MAEANGVVVMEEEIKVTYDREFDTLYLCRPGLKPKGAVEIGDFIIEFTDEMQRAVAVEILNATSVLSDVLGRDVTPQMLSHVIGARIRTVRKLDAVYVFYAITWQVPASDEENVDGTVTVPLMVKA